MRNRGKVASLVRLVSPADAMLSASALGGSDCIVWDRMQKCERCTPTHGLSRMRAQCARPGARRGRAAFQSGHMVASSAPRSAPSGIPPDGAQTGCKYSMRASIPACVGARQRRAAGWPARPMYVPQILRGWVWTTFRRTATSVVTLPQTIPFSSFSASWRPTQRSLSDFLKGPFSQLHICRHIKPSRMSARSTF